MMKVAEKMNTVILGEEAVKTDEINGARAEKPQNSNRPCKNEANKKF